MRTPGSGEGVMVGVGRGVGVEVGRTTSGVAVGLRVRIPSVQVQEIVKRIIREANNIRVFLDRILMAL